MAWQPNVFQGIFSAQRKPWQIRSINLRDSVGVADLTTGQPGLLRPLHSPLKELAEKLFAKKAMQILQVQEHQHGVMVRFMIAGGKAGLLRFASHLTLAVCELMERSPADFKVIRNVDDVNERIAILMRLLFES